MELMLMLDDVDDDVAMGGGVIMVMLELLTTALGVGPATPTPLLLLLFELLLPLFELLACLLISIKRSIRPFLKFSCLNLQYLDCSFSATGSILSDTLSVVFGTCVGKRESNNKMMWMMSVIYIINRGY